MNENSDKNDPYIGLQPIVGYHLKEKVGEGKIGVVYKAVRDDFPHVLACKIIKEGGLKQGWERELEKVLQLNGVPNVVQYHSHVASFDRQKRPIYCVFFEFIKGVNLRQYMQDSNKFLDMAFIELVFKTVLDVIYACAQAEIFHGDLHAGNILVGEPDRRTRNSQQKIYISDFGYGGTHNQLKPKEDYQELANLTSEMLRKLKEDELNPRDKALYGPFKEFVRKRLRDASRTLSSDAGNLIVEFEDLCRKAGMESASGGKADFSKEPGDYLNAEALGNRVEEWKNLFVPEFLAANDLLTRNITILTGARGCGKTMSFRRLTKLMDQIIGEPSGVKGSDEFVGFYLNCRDLVDAFPWLPKPLKEGGQQQIIHFFHLAWLAEICKTLARVDIEAKNDFAWLNKFIQEVYGSSYIAPLQNSSVISHVRAFIESEKEKCRLVKLNSKMGLQYWPLARLDFLDEFQHCLENFVPWIDSMPLYLFLDDYTVPIIMPDIQEALNPVIFKRRSQIFFKISTESANSFVPKGLNSKPLEVHHDFWLLDLATESLHQKQEEKEILLNKIFKPRIDRVPVFKGKNLGLVDVLGKTPFSNNELAWNMRDPKKHGFSGKTFYSGKEAFVGMWSSDIRIMVEMFSDMIRESNGKLNENNCLIPVPVQQRCYKTQGSEFLIFTQSVRDPELWKKATQSKSPGKDYGNHLKDIVEAFSSVSRYEMMKGSLVGNNKQSNPKQAFRLEVLDNFNLPHNVRGYFEGLVRYHIFLQDWRGKSPRGMLTPRLYLNRILIPYLTLTFSSHDHIQLSNEELIMLLAKPTQFVKYWKHKRKPTSDEGEGYLL